MRSYSVKSRETISLVRKEEQKYDIYRNETKSDLISKKKKNHKNGENKQRIDLSLSLSLSPIFDTFQRETHKLFEQR